MLRTQPVFKTVLSLVLSTMMALPTVAFAKQDSSAQPDVKDDVPVLFQQGMMNGQPGTFVMMPIDASNEESFAYEWAREHSESKTLIVNGAGDRALKAATASGNLKKLDVYVADDAMQMPMVSRGDLPVSLKRKLVNQIEKIKTIAKSDTAVGIYFAFAYSGIMGGFSTYMSSSVSTGLAVFAMYATWNTFVLSRPELYGKFIDGAGHGSVAMGSKVASMIGKELSDRDKQLYEVVGKFAASWAVNTIQATFVKGMTGEFASLSGVSGFAEGFMDVSQTGAQANYNIWDAVVLKNNADGGWFTKKRTDWYFRLMLVGGAIAEGLALQHVPGVAPALMTITMAGTLYLALNPQKQAALNKNVLRFSVALRSGVASVQRPRNVRDIGLVRKVAGGLRAMRNTCAEVLESRTTPTYNRVSHQDME